MTTNHSNSELNYYGVYLIENTITKDFYIGSTTESFQKRKGKHLSDFKQNKQNCKILFNAVKKYKINNFNFKILKAFTQRKDVETTLSIIKYLEEKYINQLKPKYNICQKPTRGGCPNLGRKLTKEWKENIAKKSKLYKHKGKTYNKVKKQNKDNSSLYVINDSFTGSLIDCAKYLNVDVCTILNSYNKKFNCSKINSIKKIKSQKKKIKIFNEDEEIIFNSYSECDKYLQMWRGFTSTQVVKNRPKLLNYDYEIFNEDIV